MTDERRGEAVVAAADAPEREREALAAAWEAYCVATAETGQFVRRGDQLLERVQDYRLEATRAEGERAAAVEAARRERPGTAAALVADGRAAAWAVRRDGLLAQAASVRTRADLAWGEAREIEAARDVAWAEAVHAALGPGAAVKRPARGTYVVGGVVYSLGDRPAEGGAS